MEKLVIYGNGRIAKIIYQFLKKQFDVVGFTVDKEFIETEDVEGLPLIAFEDLKKTFTPKDHKMLIAVGYVRMNEVRLQKYLEGKAKGYKFINYIHPSVVWHDNIRIGENNIILDYVSIQPYVDIGNSNFIWSNAVIAHGSTLMDTNWITSGVVVSGDAVIKSKCFLGVNCSIGHNVTIEDGNFIGANSLVTKSTMPNEVFISRDSEKMRLNSKRFLKFSEV
ncbi:acetyltransferase [bacterium]|jgi:sugar O-acyltransferase (sialic acid O-acetyltransferase NeuD family)|nr:acetyltransferase [bacterium]